MSSDKEKLSRSVTEQEAACRQTCEDNGWEVVDVLTDKDTGDSMMFGFLGEFVELEARKISEGIR